jgi:amino acid transporter
VCTIGVAVWVTAGGSVASYYFLDTMVFALITRNLSCAGARLRALRYTTQNSREGFDNKQDAVMAVATITGSVLAIILDFDFTSLIWLATVGNIVDNVIYIGVYHKVTTSNT